MRTAWLGFLVVAVLCPLNAGCASIAGDQEAEVHFRVRQGASGTFSYWNTLTVDTGGTTVDDARLQSVTLDTIDPEGTADLTYMTSVQGLGVGPDGQMAVFCTATSFPQGEQSITADVVFHDNIEPFFDSTDTLKIIWSGTTNPGVVFPANGFQVRARLVVTPQ